MAIPNQAVWECFNCNYENECDDERCADCSAYYWSQHDNGTDKGWAYVEETVREEDNTLTVKSVWRKR